MSAARRSRAATRCELRLLRRSFATALLDGVNGESFERNEVAALLEQEDEISTVQFGTSSHAPITKDARRRSPGKAAPLAEMKTPKVLPMLNIATTRHDDQAIAHEAARALAPFHEFRDAIRATAARLVVLNPIDGDSLPSSWAWPVEDIVRWTRLGNGVAGLGVEPTTQSCTLIERVVAVREEERQQLAEALAEALLGRFRS